MNLTVLLCCALARAEPVAGVPGGSSTPRPSLTTTSPHAEDTPPKTALASLTAGEVLPIGASMAALVLAIGALVQTSRLATKVRKLEAEARAPLSGRSEPPRDDRPGGTERARAGEPAHTVLPSRPAVVVQPPLSPPLSREPAAPAPHQEARPDPMGLRRSAFGRPAASEGASAEPERPVQSPQPAATSETSAADAWLLKLSGGRHGTLGAAIGALYVASGELAAKYRDPGNQQEFIRVVQVGLKVRMARFGNAQRGPAADFHRDWVEPDLIPILDGLSNLYSRALAEVRAGNVSAAAVATRLHEVLYLRVAPECQEAGWFTVQVIVPFETEFDPIRHAAIGSAEAPGASQRVLDIRQAGRLDVVSGTVLAPAHVLVGR